MRKFKRLNRKGFTLIELLAVIVILAVVMGIAATSVIGVMNNSRKNGLQQGAAAVADSFRVAYAEAIMNGNTSNVLGVSIAKTNTVYGLNASSFTRLNITTQNYTPAANANEVTAANLLAAMTTSFIYVDSNNNIVACMVAAKNGSYYLDQFASNAVKDTSLKVGTNPIKIKGAASPNQLMWACSNGTHSWN